MPTPMLANDLVVNEDDCNLSCSYCLTGQSTMKEQHLERRIFNPPRIGNIGEGTALRADVEKVEQRVRDATGCPILKVTGGEIFLIRGMFDYLRSVRERYETLIIQTNGVLVSETHIAEFERWKNVVMQVSLDGHRFDGNSLRVRTERLHHRIMRPITRLLQSDLRKEIYTVLTSHNVETLMDFMHWLKANDIDTQLIPFPVRGPEASRWRVRDDQIPHIEALVADYDAYERWLPVRPYLERLLRFYHDGERRFRCHLPRMVLSTFSDGVVNACPNIWFDSVGNLLQDDWERVMARVGRTGLFKALLAPLPRLAACKGCFTPWDLLSMYFDDEISLEELCRVPSYNGPRARQILRELKESYRSQDAMITASVASASHPSG